MRWPSGSSPRTPDPPAAHRARRPVRRPPTCAAVPSGGGGRRRRRRRSIAVTMRPRRLRLPAISGGASGMRVIACSPRMSRTASTGTPQSWSATVRVTKTYAPRRRRRQVARGRPRSCIVSCIRSCIELIPVIRLMRGDRFGQALLQAGDQRLALELGDVVGEAGIAAGLDVSRLGVRRSARSSAASPRGRRHARARAKSSPSMSGISMSETITSNIAPASRSRSASAALGAAVTR